MSDTYDDPRAHALRERYLATFGGDELPVPVESIAEDLLGLAVERRELDVSGMLFPAERRILVNASRAGDAAALHDRPRAGPLDLPVPRRFG